MKVTTPGVSFLSFSNPVRIESHDPKYIPESSQLSHAPLFLGKEDDVSVSLRPEMNGVSESSSSRALSALADSTTASEAVEVLRQATKLGRPDIVQVYLPFIS